MQCHLVILVSLLAIAQATCPDTLPAAKTSSPATWPPGFTFSNGSHVTVDFPLLLDTSSPRLASLHLLSGGHLVFSPHAALAKLTAGYVIVDTGTSLTIGTERCPFGGKAEILLTGRKDSYELDGDYRHNGEKFLAVMAGGKLEIHGRNKLSWTKLSKTVEANEGLVTLHLEDDVSSWEPGDNVVLASTDFDMNQAEEVKVKVCQWRECVVEGGLKYHHYGLVDSGVDMRGEVGLITRNVLIHGEMEEECYGSQPCHMWGRDLFGGHVIAREGFDTFKVEHAEVTNMGQQGVMARYPLHWHMAGDLVQGRSYVRNNSIHHNHQRCVTCHGSMGCVIEDNMAFETLGHCFFMEDGVEAATTMRGNLGINTRRGSMIPSDSDPATFWITHPNSTITHNVAAGSQGKGFWFLQGANPTGVSKKLQDAGDKHYFDEDELFHTALVDISHNAAHSSKFGIFFDKELGPDQSATGSGQFDPWKDPKNSKSGRLDSHIQDLTCYKCLRTCVWIHLMRGQFSGIKTAESGEGMFTHDPTVISNSLFVGVSDGNMGVGRNWYRSLPSTNHQFGIRTYANPILLYNSEFRSFGSTSLANIKSTAIGVKRSGVKSVLTGAHNITWINVAPRHRIHEHKQRRQLLYRDYSGSVSGHPNTTVVHTFPHLVSDRCVAAPAWGPVSVCPHRYIGLPRMVSTLAANMSQLAVTRDDLPDYSFSPPSGDSFFYLSTDHSHIISFVDIDLPSSKLMLRPRGLDNGMVVQLGVCVPLGATVKVHKNSPVSSMRALQEDDTGVFYFHDEEAGVVFVKMIGTYVRQHLDVDPCGKDGSACPRFPVGKLIKIDGSGSLNLKADCRKRTGVYPKYQIATMGNDLSIPCPLPSQDHPSITGLVGQIPREDLNKKDVMGWSPLHVACWANNVSAVNDLLSIAEVEVNEKDVNDDTPAMVAAAYCSKEALQAMLMDRRVELDGEGVTEEYRIEEVAGNVQGSSESKRTVRKAIRDERRLRSVCLQSHSCQQCGGGKPGVGCTSAARPQHHVRLGGAENHQFLDSPGTSFRSEMRPSRPHRRSSMQSARRTYDIAKTSLPGRGMWSGLDTPGPRRSGSGEGPIEDGNDRTVSPVRQSKTVTGSVGTSRRLEIVTPRPWPKQDTERKDAMEKKETTVPDGDEIEEMRSNVKQQYSHKIQEMNLRIKAVEENGDDESQDEVEKLKKVVDKLTKDLANLETESECEETNERAGDRKKTEGDLGAAQRELECPVCLNQMKPPTRIWMCSSSHLICQTCKEMMRGNLCPTCRTVQVSMRALFAEHIAATLFKANSANLQLELD